MNGTRFHCLEIGECLSYDNSVSLPTPSPLQLNQLPAFSAVELIIVPLNRGVYRLCLSLLYCPPSLFLDIFGALQSLL